MNASSNISVYNLLWARIVSAKYLNSSMEDLFLMRVTAFRLIAEADETIKEIAQRFLLDTMMQSEQEYDFASKEKFAARVEHWDIPEIIAMRSGDINAVLYKINYYSGGQKQTLHEISFFQKNHGDQFKYTHKYDLNSLSNQYFPVYPKGSIRQIGDPILQREAKDVLDFSNSGQDAINNQLRILKDVLVKTGGVGIAANQCVQVERPLKVVIAGVDYQNPEHVAKAVARYPTTLFPQMQIFINPVIKDLSNTTEIFAEGCLSVQGVLRGQVKRPSSVTVSYQDLNGDPQIKKFEGSDARVMLHEVDHILNGKVYIQRIIDELNTDQLNRFLIVVRSSLETSEEKSVGSTFSTPTVVFKRNEKMELYFSEGELNEAISKMSRTTLVGIHQDIVSVLGSPRETEK